MKSLVLGGVKSGKSRFAEQRAADCSDAVCYVATAQALDDEMRERIARHQQQRPVHWRVCEEPLDIASVLTEVSDELVLVDCLTLWMSNLLSSAPSRADVDHACEQLVRAVSQREGELILVSNETNMGVIPVNAMARQYCDAMGSLHQQLARHCDEVILVLAGLPLYLKGGSI